MNYPYLSLLPHSFPNTFYLFTPHAFIFPLIVSIRFFFDLLIPPGFTEFTILISPLPSWLSNRYFFLQHVQSISIYPIHFPGYVCVTPKLSLVYSFLILSNLVTSHRIFLSILLISVTFIFIFSFSINSPKNT